MFQNCCIIVFLSLVFFFAGNEREREGGKTAIWEKREKGF